VRQAVRALAALFLLVTAVPAPALADWIRVRSANFVVVSDASERDVRRAAAWLEQFRQAMLQALPGELVASPVPTIVVAFGRSRTFESFTPHLEGRQMDDVSGYFVGNEDLNYIAVNLGRGDRAFSTILHEYTHFLVENALGPVPVWVDEGLAQYYETFEVRDDGIAIIGMPLAEHLDALRRNRMPPLENLLRVDRASPTYTQDEHGRGLFYAQSWALVHYLLRGGPARDGQLGAYLARLRGGGDAEASFAGAFGENARAALEDELRDYVSQSRMTALAFRLDVDPAADDVGPVQPLDEREADVYLGDLLARVGRVDAARARLERVLEDRPDQARAASALGLIALRDDQLDAALPLLERGADAGPDDALALGAYGRGLVAQLASQSGDDFETTLRRARDVLERAVALDPETAPISALAGYTAALDGDVDVAVARLRHALTLTPTNELYQLRLAEALVAAGDWDGANRYLDPLVGAGRTAATRQRALELMTEMVLARVRAATPPPPAEPEPAATRVPEPPPVGTPPPVAVSRPVLRSVESGETRVVGRLRGVLCRGGARVIVVETAGGLLRLRRHASREFVYVAYVAGAPAAIACGELTPARRVLATYVAPAPPARPDIDGDAVAIEIVPEGFTP